MLLKKKKAQIAIIDLFTALSVFIILILTIIVLFNFYTIRLQENIFREELRDKAFMLGEILLSTGKPVDWDYSTVEIIGLARYDRHIQEERFNEFKDNITYVDAKGLLGLGGFDFYVRLTELDGNFIGDYGNDISLEKQEVVALRRIIFYEDEPARMEVRVWRTQIRTG